MDILLTLIYLVPILVLMGMGLLNFGRISRISGIPYFWPWDVFRLYKHAFTTMRGSRETRFMLIGFIGAIAWVFVGAGLVFVIAGKH
jgi:hypothetical protein